MNEVFSDSDMKYFTAKHYEQVVCTDCKEWTEYGESCCGKTECDPECPICLEKAGE